ncbi:MAG: GGDEF domain-containing protein [Bacillota bacterium]|nr:GGDEF domain-containing protein [Bacillota bacterium]
MIRKNNDIGDKNLFSLLDSLPLGILEVDKTGRLLFINTNLREELDIIGIKLKNLKITDFIENEFWEFLIDQIETREVVSNYQKKIGDKVYQLTLNTRYNNNEITYLLIFSDRTIEIDYGLKLEKVMNNLEGTIAKRTKSLQNFKDIAIKLSEIENSNIIDEYEFLKIIFHIGLDLLDKVDLGSIYLFENDKVNFIETIGHNKEKLNKLQISILDFDFPTNSVRYVKNITDKTDELFNERYEINESKSYTESVISAKETIIIGLSFNNKITGGISYEISSDSKETFSNQDRELFKVLANFYNSYYKNFKSQKKKEKIMKIEQKSLKNELRLDDLTGLYNKKYFNELFEEYWFNAFMSQVNISILMFDIDNFKNYNDTYGHVRGDFVLKEVATALKIRENDIVARYGGEEFIALFFNKDHKTIVNIAERIRKNIELLNIENLVSEDKRKLTISIGVATTTPKENSDRIKLIEKADESLYKAKNSGRNKVCSIKI